jgi:multidrug efflux pump
MLVSGMAIGTLFTLFILPVIYQVIASEHKPDEIFDEDKGPALLPKPA